MISRQVLIHANRYCCDRSSSAASRRQHPFATRSRPPLLTAWVWQIWADITITPSLFQEAGAVVRRAASRANMSRQDRTGNKTPLGNPHDARDALVEEMQCPQWHRGLLICAPCYAEWAQLVRAIHRPPWFAIRTLWADPCPFFWRRNWNGTAVCHALHSHMDIRRHTWQSHAKGTKR